MTQNYVSVIFDRKKHSKKNGKGKIELYIRLNRNCRKYLTIGECSIKEWKAGMHRNETHLAQASYELKIVSFVESGIEQSLENLNSFLALRVEQKKNLRPRQQHQNRKRK